MSVLLISEGKHELGGALENLVSRLNARMNDLQTMKISDPAFRTTHGKGHRYFKRADRCLLYAIEHEFEAVILLIDQDGDTERTEQLSRAQEHLTVPTPRAFGVAIRTFDAWMLADETALSAVLDAPVPTQPNPEGIDDPKRVCRDFLEKTTSELSQTEMYAALAALIRLDVLEKRCPDGFAAFAQRIRAL